VTDNRAALDSNTTRDATALRILAEPAYFQVADGLDLTRAVWARQKVA
jgi:hypothetical protein